MTISVPILLFIQISERKPVLLHLRSFCKIFVCAYHTLARIKVVHLRSVLVLHLRLHIHSFFVGQLLVFEPRCKKIGLRGSVFESFLNLKHSCKIPGFPRFVLKCSILKIKS